MKKTVEGQVRGRRGHVRKRKTGELRKAPR